MKRICGRQCAACPFRTTSMPGWLGAYRPEDVVRAPWSGSTFFCHSRIDYSDAGWRERADRTGVLCRGYLLFRHAMLAPASADAEIRAAEAQAVTEANDDPAAVDVLQGIAFVQHHSMPPDEVAAFLDRMRLDSTRSSL